jgi:hypothetical protein
VLAFGGLEGSLGELVGTENLAVAEPGGQALDAELAKGGRSLVARQ